MTLINRNQEDATRHEARSRNYRRQAQLLLDRDHDLDSASALLYESAKQCINAVANQNGNNPGPTGAKVRYLEGLAERDPEDSNLILNWQFAGKLHIHADRGHLNLPNFMEAWSRTQTFIDQMLQIYAGGE